MKKILIALSILMLTFMGCGREETKKIKVGYLPIIAHLPAQIAFEKGYYGDVTVEFQVYATSNDLLSSLSNGDIDVATTIAIAPILSVTGKQIETQKDISMRIFSYSKTTSDSPFDKIFVKKNSTIISIKDLEGKRIGVFPGTTAKNILKKYLDDSSIQTEKIKWINLPPNMQIDALLSDDIDALYTYEPTCTIAEKNGLKCINGSVIASVLNGAPYGGSAINRKFEKNNPNTSKKFIEGFDKGILFERENAEDSRLILSKTLNIPSDIANNCNLENRLTSKESMETENLQRFQEFMKILSKMGEISKDYNIELLFDKNK